MILFFALICITFAHNLQLSDKVSVAWEPVQGEQDLWEFTVTALGVDNQYVGFGFSSSGSMKGAELYTFFPATQKLHVHLSYGFVKPTFQKEWALQSSAVESGRVEFTFRRGKCSEFEPVWDFNAWEIFFLYAHGDPTFVYHGQVNRGAQLVSIVNGPNVLNLPEGDTEVVASLNEEVGLGDDGGNSYKCTFVHTKGYEHPTKPTKLIRGYMIQFSNPEYERYVHHALMFACPIKYTQNFNDTAALASDLRLASYKSNLDWVSTKKTFECARMPPDCFDFDAGFAAGQKGFDYGPDRGKSTNAYTYIMQLHLYNPAKETGHFGSFGIKLHYHTENVDTIIPATPWRVMGSLFQINVPPREKNVMHTHCTSAYTKGNFKKPYYLSISQVHSHLYVTRHRAHVTRANGDIELLYDGYYDYTHQASRSYSTEPIIYPGDHIEFECHFDNSKGDERVVGGDGTHEEMCFWFVTLFPVDKVKGSVGICSNLNDPEHKGVYNTDSSRTKQANEMEANGVLMFYGLGRKTFYLFPKGTTEMQQINMDAFNKGKFYAHPLVADDFVQTWKPEAERNADLKKGQCGVYRSNYAGPVTQAPVTMAPAVSNPPTSDMCASPAAVSCVKRCGVCTTGSKTDTDGNPCAGCLTCVAYLKCVGRSQAPVTAAPAKTPTVTRDSEIENLGSSAVSVLSLITSLFVLIFSCL